MGQRLRMITLGVNDLKKSTEFYEGNFGWSKVSSSNENITIFYLDRIQLDLFNWNHLAKNISMCNNLSEYTGEIISDCTRREVEIDEIVKNLADGEIDRMKEPNGAVAVMFQIWTVISRE